MADNAAGALVAAAAAAGAAAAAAAADGEVRAARMEESPVNKRLREKREEANELRRSANSNR